jgi:hypothetical protein
MKTLTTRAGLSSMWIFVMLNMFLADILGFMNSSMLKMYLSGHAEQTVITPTLLLTVAVVTQIPIAMIVLSRVLPDGANRWANIVAAVVTAVYVLGGSSFSAPQYIFLVAVQIMGCALIAWSAWSSVPSHAASPELATSAH